MRLLRTGKPLVYDGVWEERVRFLSFDNGDLEEVEQKKKPASSALDRYTPYAKLWRKAAHTEVLGASALGICFAERLCKLGGEQIPIGVISLGFGGRELRSFVQPKNAEKLSGYGDKSSIYANFIEPLLKFPIRGVIWYQGEANAAYYSEYADGFLVFAEQLRADKAQTSYADFPFYLVERRRAFRRRWCGRFSVAVYRFRHGARGERHTAVQTEKLLYLRHLRSLERRALCQ